MAATPYKTEVLSQAKAAKRITELGGDVESPAGKIEGATVYDFGGTFTKWSTQGRGQVKLEHFSGACPC